MTPSPHPLPSGERIKVRGNIRRLAMVTDKKKITKDAIIGDVIKMSPEAKKVIKKYFGNGCFTCAGINMESISFGSMMHNMDPNKIVDEINALEG